METFAEAGLRSEILQAIEEMGFEKPTPIQQKAIPALLEDNRNLIALAQTGTGKTAAFGLPLIQKLDPQARKPQAIILSPTRELCIQIHKELEKYSKYLKGLHMVAVYGGSSIDTQIRAIRQGCHVVVGTPGRTLDLIRRGKLALGSIETVILDEADEMLNMGFQEDLNAILAETPEDKQTLLFSATMPPEIARISRQYMEDPLTIEVGARNASSANVSHEYYVISARYRYEALKRILDFHPNIYGIIFCRTRQNTKDIAAKLSQDGYSADAIHGDLSQAQRDFVMNRFRRRQLQLLVATDVAARGIDVNELTHVINFEIPDELEVYIHRSGRTGRAGNIGVSISLVHGRQIGKVRELQRIAKKKFERKLIPSGEEACERQLMKWVDQVAEIEVPEEQINPLLEKVGEKLEGFDREELIQRFLSVNFTQLLEYYKKAPDLNIRERSRDRDRDRRGGRDGYDRFDRDRRRSRTHFTRFYVNLGSKNNINPNRLMGLVNEILRNRSVRIGKIEIMRKFSFVEVDSNYAQQLLKGYHKAEFDGLPVVFEVAAANAPNGYGRKDFSDSKEKKKKKKRRSKRKPHST